MLALLQNLANFVNTNTYVNAALTLFLVLYAGLAKPQLPTMITSLFDNALFRLVVLFLVAYLSSQNAQVALMVAVAFVVTMNMLSEQRMVEGFFAGIQAGGGCGDVADADVDAGEYDME